MSVTRYVNMAFVVVGLLIWIFVAGFFGFVFDLIGPQVNRSILGAGFTLNDLVGLLAGLVGAGLLWRHPRVNGLAHEIANELKKVTWPTWAETKVATIVVVVTTIIIAAILGLFDAVWSSITGFIYNI
jgi:preprotein translocase subunit SecE